jgi:hypothetical protein
MNGTVLSHGMNGISPITGNVRQLKERSGFFPVFIKCLEFEVVQTLW